MVHLRKLFRQIITLIVLIGLVAMTLWLVGNQRQPSTPLAAQTIKPSRSTVVPSATLTNPPPPRPTTTPTNPNVGYTPPSVGVVVTLISPSTPAPSPTPTPTFEPLSDKPIGGYVFRKPELVMKTNRNIDILSWLPGNSEELLIRSYLEDQRFTLEVLDVRAGTRQLIVETRQAILDAIWLSKVEQVAYLTFDNTGTKLELWLADNKKGIKEKVIDDVLLPLLPGLDGKTVRIRTQQKQLLTGKDSIVFQTQPTGEIGKAFSTREDGKPAHYSAAWSPNNNWIAYYNNEKFFLFNSSTLETKEINIENDYTDNTYIEYAVWSPDNTKLALIVGSSDNPSSFTELAILNIVTEKLQKIKDNFTYVSNVTWAPDNHQMLVSAVTGQIEGFNTIALFLVDTKSLEITPVPVIPTDPQNALGLSTYHSLMWSLDGRQLVVGYGNLPDEAGWYHVSVQVP